MCFQRKSFIFHSYNNKFVKFIAPSTFRTPIFGVKGRILWGKFLPLGRLFFPIHQDRWGFYPNNPQQPPSTPQYCGAQLPPREELFNLIYHFNILSIYRERSSPRQAKLTYSNIQGYLFFTSLSKFSGLIIQNSVIIPVIHLAGIISKA